MKRLFYDGVVAVTTDEVADAVLELALVVARYNIYEQVTIPVDVQGSGERLTLMLGPTIHLSALTDATVAEVVVPDAMAVTGRLRDRVRELREPLHGVEIDVSAWIAEQ